MELRQLKYFVAVAKTLNFSEAAKKLFVTQGTLSQQIRQLEYELGVQLLFRTSHSVMLTEAGEEMLPMAIRTIDASNECLLKISDINKALSGSLNIGLTSSFKDLLTGTLKRFIKEHPKVQLKLFCGTATEIHEMLLDRKVDFILSFKPATGYSQVESEPLFESDLAVVMRKSHPLAGNKKLTLNDLAKQHIILPGSGIQSRKAFERFVDLNTEGIEISAEINDPGIIIELLHDTNMVGIVSSLATKYDPELVAIPLVEAPRHMVGCVHWLQDSYRKRSAEIFLEMLRDSAILTRMKLEM